jgi:adenylyltransferase/sulfurtransferase
MKDDAQGKRYHRQVLLPEIGEEGQRRLETARVLVIGAGGLGSPLLQYLAAAGVGTIGIVEFDRVEVSNLHRQVLFSESDIGKSKVQAAMERIHAQNAEIKINVHEHYLTASTALSLLEGYDVVADGSDNLPTRYLVNDACVLAGKPLVSGAIYRMEGQISVFNQLLPQGTRSADYRDIYPEPPAAELVPSCEQAGVLGSLAGIIGSIMANEVLKLVVGFGSTLHNRLLVVDAMDMSFRNIRYQRQQDRLPINALFDYEAFCDRSTAAEGITELTPKEVRSLLDANKVVVIDVRDPEEYATANIGGVNLPLSLITQQAFRIPRQIRVVMVCKSGARSIKAVRKLEDVGISNLIVMRGGLNRWRAEVDGTLPAC